MLLNLFAYFIIPAYTLLFVKGYGWFTTNFSVIGNCVHRKDAFVLWGILVGSYFYYTLRTVVKRMRTKPKGTCLIPLSLLLLFCAVTTPYLPEELPFKSFLHIVFAFLAAVLLLVFLAFLLGTLCSASPAVYSPCLYMLAGITAGSVFLFCLAGIISSALELFFTIGTVILTRRLLSKVTRENSL